MLHAIPSENYAIWDDLGARCRATMGWLRGVSLTKTVSGPFKYPFLYPPEKLVVRDINADDHTFTVSGLHSLIKSVRSDFVVDPNNHHSIANLVGPVSLAGALGVDRELSTLAKTPQRRALSKLLRVFDWIEADQRKSHFAEYGIYDVDVDPCGALENVRYWLVDDQAGMGYGEVLADALGATPGNNKSTVGDVGRTIRWPEGSGADLVNSLLNHLESKELSDWAMPRLIKDIDVLFLDLRLWLRWPSSRDRHPLASVVQKAAQLLGSGSADLPANFPDPLLQEALTAACNAIGKDDKSYPRDRPDEKTELVALTLLPLLLSHYDASLPIVVFSSTSCLLYTSPSPRD